MKKLILLLSIVLLASCSSDDDNVRLNDFDAIETILPEGNWKISKYIDDEEDKTEHFNGFVFDFMVDGIVTASNDILSESGTWSYDNDPNDQELDIRFDETSILDDISDDWDIVSVSRNKIELIDKYSDGETDYLTFVRI